MKKVIPQAVIAILFLFASYNVYTFFVEKQRIKAQEHAKKMAQIELEQSKVREQQRKDELEHQQQLNELELAKQKTEAELLQKKVENQQNLSRYHELKDARKREQENRRLQKRIDSARRLGNPEGLPEKMLEGIHSATHLVIRNNPQDYIGKYTPAPSVIRKPKLTQGGADSLMLFAMVSDDVKAIGEIIALDHDINATNKLGYTPLMFASAYNSPEIVSFFVESGADTQANEYVTQGNALHIATRFNPKPETTQQLVNLGVGIESLDSEGNTPLLSASKYNKNIQVVEKLIELGADISATDENGNNAYFYLSQRLNERYPKYSISKISSEYESDVLQQLKS